VQNDKKRLFPAPKLPVANLWSLQMKNGMNLSYKYKTNASRYMDVALRCRDSSKLHYIINQLEGARSIYTRTGLVKEVTSEDVRLGSKSSAKRNDAPFQDMDSSCNPLQFNGNTPELLRTSEDHHFMQTIASAHENLKPLIKDYETDKDAISGGDQHTSFIMHRLQRLLAQYDHYWQDKKATRAFVEGREPPPTQLPYIDEQASVLQSMMLKDVLFTRHRTRRRRHPKWVEIEWVFKKWHRAYLHKRRIAREEAKEKLGIRKSSLGKISGVVE